MKRVLIALATISFASGAALAETPGTPPGAGAAATVATPTAGASAPSAVPEITAPTEVGSTTMPAGNYLITEQSSGKSYVLMVSSKGTMILSPAPHGAGVGAAVGGAVGAPASAAVGASAAVKGLMTRGLEKGAMELLESGATKQIKNFIPK